jgi:hypothetical protein
MAVHHQPDTGAGHRRATSAHPTTPVKTPTEKQTLKHKNGNSQSPRVIRRGRDPDADGGQNSPSLIPVTTTAPRPRPARLRRGLPIRATRHKCRERTLMPLSGLLDVRFTLARVEQMWSTGAL